MNRVDEILSNIEYEEAAISKKEMINKISSYSATIGEHILKVLLFKDEANSKHCKDLDNFIRICRELRKVYIPKYVIYNSIKEYWDKTNIKEVLSNQLKDYLLLPKTHLFNDLDKVWKYLYEILEVVSTYITNTAIIDMKSVLDEYLSKEE